MQKPKSEKRTEQGQPNNAVPVSLDQLPAEIRSKIQNLTPERRKQFLISVISSSVTTSYKGPIPDPETYRRYEETHPGSADRILRMAENQSSHRIEMEKYISKRQMNQSSTGQWMAFILSILFLGCGSFLIYNDHDWAGGAIVTSTLIGLAYVFIKGKYAQREDLNKKS